MCGHQGKLQVGIHISSWFTFGLCTVRKVSLYLTDDATYCKALCDEKIRPIDGNGRKFSHIEFRNKASSNKFSNSVGIVVFYVL